MEPIVRTIHGAYLQTCQLLGLSFTLKENTSLNDKFLIHHEYDLSDTDMPRVRYITIGNGGHGFTTGADGIPKPEPVQHLPKHSSLYNHLPFVLRKVSEDLTAGERSLYRLRRLETHNNELYAAYYAKVLDMKDTIPQLELREVDDGVITTTPYIPTITDLNPVPPSLPNNTLINTSGNYIAATAKVPFTMSEWEIVEFLNACEVKYGDSRYGIISEIGLCSGLDKNVVGDFNGIITGYIDAVAVQIVSFLNVFYAANFSNTGVNVTFDVGSVEPLLF